MLERSCSKPHIFYSLSVAYLISVNNMQYLKTPLVINNLWLSSKLLIKLLLYLHTGSSLSYSCQSNFELWARVEPSQTFKGSFTQLLPVQMSVGVSSLLFIAHYLSTFYLLSFPLLWASVHHSQCVSHISPSLPRVSPTSFHQPSAVFDGTSMFLKCQFLLYFRKTCNYHFSQLFFFFFVLGVRRRRCLSFQNFFCIHAEAIVCRFISFFFKSFLIFSALIECDETSCSVLNICSLLNVSYFARILTFFTVLSLCVATGTPAVKCTKSRSV